MWLHTAHAAEAARTGAPVHADRAGAFDLLPEPYEPVKRLKQIIRFLYELLGGDPAELTESNSLNADMMMLVNYYGAHGVPSDLTSQEQADGRLLVEEAYALAFTLADIVDPQVLSVFVAALESIYTELGGDPNDLHRAPATGG